MTSAVYDRQPSDHVIDLSDWNVDDEHYPYAPGTKPKGLVRSSENEGRPFLRSNHLYMFKYGDDWRRGQFWSEVIAYELSKLCGVEVPASFVAVGGSGEGAGCLQELFVGGVGPRKDARLVHGADLIQRKNPNFDQKRGRPHLLMENVRLCRGYQVQNALEGWARIIAFDALIGNTDRHPENWGLLRTFSEDVERFELAPIYDNGTSLGYEVHEDKLVQRCDSDQIDKYVKRGTHHIQGHRDDRVGIHHVDLCQMVRDQADELREVIIRVVNVDLKDVEEILAWCCDFDVDPAFTPERANFVRLLIEKRRSLILASMEAKL